MKHEFSLVSKLAAMDVGDILYFPDEGPSMRATNMERQVQDRIAKSMKLIGRKFMTTRCDAITVARTHEYILRVERLS